MKLKLGYVALAMLVLAMPALAGDTATVNVSATVVGTCKFSSGGAVSFTLDPSVAGPVNGTVSQPQFWCTKGASYTLSDDDGVNASGGTQRMKHATLNEYIPYTFVYTTSGTGLGRTSPVTMDIASQVAFADFQDASAGNYTDTVTLTINP